MRFKNIKLSNLYLFFLILTIPATAMAGKSLDESLLGKYGPDKDAFLKLCSAFLNKKGTAIKQGDVCFVYFIGVRNGYLTAAHKTVDKAALYYALDGKVTPGADKRSENWSKAFNSNAYTALEANGVSCVKEVPPVELLQEFYDFLEKQSRNIGASVLFDEFVHQRYAGKC